MQLSALTASLGRFLAELQRRKVLRIAAAYVVGAWIVLQVALALQTAMSLSGQFSAAILALLVIGFFVTLVLSWFYEITPEGVKRTAPAAGDAPLVKPQTTDLALAGVLGLVIVFGVVQLVMPGTTTPAPGAPTPAPATTIAEAPAVKPEPPRLGDKSIAVLPFANLSAEKKDEYFADGLAEEILHLLAKVGDLNVISRTSSFAFKGKNEALPKIAEVLGVRHILEGSVRSDGDDLRVTAQLIDVVTDTHLWSKTYDRKTEGVFALQAEIARDIAAALKVEVALSAFGGNAPTNDLVAYRFYLEGVDSYHRRDIRIAEATELFKKAVAQDPKFAEAHAMLATAYVSQLSGVGEPKLIELARASAMTAIKLKPTLGLGYGVLSRLDRRSGLWEAAMANAQKAVALSPEESYVKLWYGTLLLMVGHAEAARAAQLDALRTDPFMDGAQAMLMFAEAARGNQSAAEVLGEKLTKSPDAVSVEMAHAYLARSAYDRGDGAKAVQHYLHGLLPAERERSFAVAMVKALQSEKAKRAAIEALMAEAPTNPVAAIRGLGFLRAYDEALDLITKLHASGHPGFFASLTTYVWDDRSKAARQDPRWRALVKSTGLADYWKKHGWPDRCRPKGEDDFECS